MPCVTGDRITRGQTNGAVRPATSTKRPAFTIPQIVRRPRLVFYQSGIKRVDGYRREEPQVRRVHRGEDRTTCYAGILVSRSARKLRSRGRSVIDYFHLTDAAIFRS